MITRTPLLAVVACAVSTSIGCSGNDVTSAGTPDVTGAGGVNGGGEAGASSAGAGAGGVANGGTSSGVGGANGGARASAGGASPDGGGAPGAGGASPNAGGAPGAGGATPNTGGANGAGGGVVDIPKCKRGMATNTAPGAAFYPWLSWWYNWGSKATGTDVGIEFTPMVWDETHFNDPFPVTASYLLGFNEPNFFAQAKLSPTEAAALWPQIETRAAALGAKIVSPALNFCGPDNACYGTNPYTYLKEFFAACPSCKVDYVAVHWYNCDLPSLKDYLEPGGGLEGFEQFGKPIWLTEFSCNSKASVADNEKFMRAAVPYLEANPHVFRYSWFSAGPIPNARLTKSDGSPTDLGSVYMTLPRICN